VWARGRRGGSSTPPRDGDYGLLLTHASGDNVSGPSPARYFKRFTGELGEIADDDRLLALLSALDLQLIRPRLQQGEPDRPAFVAQRGLPDMAVLDPVLSSTELADAYAGLVDSIPAHSYQVAAALKDVARYWYARKPVAHLLP
jgi:hypothetical protein